MKMNNPLSHPQMIDRDKWESKWNEFRNSKLLWFVNRTLHLFGWAIVYYYDGDGTLLTVYPEQVPFRGFQPERDTAGYVGLTQYMALNSERLLQEVTDE